MKVRAKGARRRRREGSRVGRRGFAVEVGEGRETKRFRDERRSVKGSRETPILI